MDKRLWEMKGKNKDAETLEFNYYCLKKYSTKSLNVPCINNFSLNRLQDMG